MTDAVRRSDVFTVRALLDDALLRLRRVEEPSVPVRDAARFLAAALEAIYQALADRGDADAFVAGCARALEATRESLATLQFVPTRDPATIETSGQVASAIAILRGTVRIPADPSLSLPKAPNGAAPRMLASVDAPRELAFPRPVIRPAIPLPERPPVPPPSITVDATPSGKTSSSLEELEALLASALAAHAAAPAALASPEEPLDPLAVSEPPALPDAVHAYFGGPLHRRSLDWARARTFFEDLGSFSGMRRPDPGDVWRELKPVEDRLLARVDALIACGTDLYPELLVLLEDRPVPDPDLSWAALFLFGSLAGTDAKDQIRRLLSSFDLDDAELFDAAADALALAPQQGIGELAREALGSELGAQRALGLRVLSRRKTAFMEEIRNGLSDSDLRVRLEAVRALENAPIEVTSADLHEALRCDEEDLVRAAIEVSIIRGLPDGRRRCLELLETGRPSFAHAALYAALLGPKALVASLQEAAATDPSDAVIEALGWFGDLSFVDFLLGRLRHGQQAAGLALYRLFGVPLTDEVPMPDTDGRPPFASEPFIPPEHEPVLSADAEVWAAFWELHRGSVKAELRYRHGRPFEAAAPLWEVDLAPTTPTDRRRAYLELLGRWGGAIPLDAQDFVVRQERQVSALAEHVSRRGAESPRGGWPTTKVGR